MLACTGEESFLGFSGDSSGSTYGGQLNQHVQISRGAYLLPNRTCLDSCDDGYYKDDSGATEDRGDPAGSPCDRPSGFAKGRMIGMERDLAPIGWLAWISIPGLTTGDVFSSFFPAMFKDPGSQAAG